MPHIISDDISPDILFEDLSDFYLGYKQNPNFNEIQPDRGYKDYQSKEQQAAQSLKNKDIIFWKIILMMLVYSPSLRNM